MFVRKSWMQSKLFLAALAVAVGLSLGGVVQVTLAADEAQAARHRAW